LCTRRWPQILLRLICCQHILPHRKAPPVRHRGRRVPPKVPVGGAQHQLPRAHAPPHEAPPEPPPVAAHAQPHLPPAAHEHVCVWMYMGVCVCVCCVEGMKWGCARACESGVRGSRAACATSPAQPQQQQGSEGRMRTPPLLSPQQRRREQPPLPQRPPLPPPPPRQQRCTSDSSRHCRRCRRRRHCSKHAPAPAPQHQQGARAAVVTCFLKTATSPSFLMSLRAAFSRSYSTGS
jgi:hypothetical protein